MECISRNFLVFLKPVYFVDSSESAKAPVLVSWEVDIESRRALALFSPLILHQLGAWTMAPLKTHNGCNASLLMCCCVCVWLCVVAGCCLQSCMVCIVSVYNNYHDCMLIDKGLQIHNYCIIDFTCVQTLRVCMWQCMASLIWFL